MASGVPAELLTQALYTIGDVVRGCPNNQALLVSLLAPSDPPQPAITVLLVTMVNERQQLFVRMAVLYAFQCLLASNPDIQEQIVSTLLPRDSARKCPLPLSFILSRLRIVEMDKPAIAPFLRTPS